MSMTIEQQRAIALASARARAAAAQQAPAPYDPTADMSGGQKVLANIGGGMMDLAQGAQSLWTDLTGGEDEKRALESEIADKRARDEQLANATTGGKALQIAGKALPLMVVPGLGVAANAGRAAMAGSGALGGALGGALEARGADDSRGANIALGTAGGAALGALSPELGAILRAAGRTVTSPLQTARSALEALRSPLQTLGNRQARGAVAQAVAEEAPEGARAALNATADRLQAPAAPRRGLPLSVAAREGDPALARLEAGSRARNGANWFDFDQAQARAADDLMQRATSAADDLPAREALRRNNYRTNRAQAMGSIDDAGFSAERDQLRANLDQAMLSPEASTAGVRPMLAEVANELDRVGAGFGPEHLANIRANLSAAYNPMSPNVYHAAPRNSPATISLLREVDNILNGVSSGRWQDAVSGYARDSGAVNSATAAARVRGSFRDPVTNRVLGVSADPLGNVPQIQQGVLDRAIKAARMKDGEPGLSEGAQQQLGDLLGDIRRQDIVKLVKKSATAGGGSNTASDTIAGQAAGAGADALAGQIPLGRGALQAFRNALSSPKDQALARALQNQDTMAEMMREAATRRGRDGGLWAPDESELMQLVRALRGQ